MDISLKKVILKEYSVKGIFKYNASELKELYSRVEVPDCKKKRK